MQCRRGEEEPYKASLRQLRQESLLHLPTPLPFPFNRPAWETIIDCGCEIMAGMRHRSAKLFEDLFNLGAFLGLRVVNGDCFQEFCDDGFRRLAFGFSRIVQDEAMSQDAGGHGADVVDGDFGAAVEGGAGAGGHDEGLPAARADAPEDPILDERGDR
jgi:hypothetical protein